MRLKVLDLFSGIGGFSLGLERTGGFETVAFCEIEPYCRAVLRKHWPDVPCYEDVRELTAERLAADGIAVDVICGGFPCQDISNAGKQAGLSGERSGLWSEYARLIRELRPQFVVVENVAALLGRGLGDVLGDLAEIGYDALWDCIPACAVGAPHQRDRVWIVAHAHSARPQGWVSQVLRERASEWTARPSSPLVADTDGERLQTGIANRGHRVSPTRPAGHSEPASVGGHGAARDWWRTEPDVGRVAHGVPARVDRLRGLGNAVVPQIPELIGKAILETVKEGEGV